jgi:protein-S-isoprenylcysteine O-methyltransferase Ste14
MVFGLVKAMNKQPIPRTVLLAFAVLLVLTAQFWLPMNLLPWPGGDYDNLLEFPKQLYFGHYGVWMGWPAYVVQGCVFLLGFWWFTRTLHAKRQREGRSLFVRGSSA